MKRGNRAFNWLVLVCFLAATAFAVDRFLAMQTAKARCENAIADLDRARSLLGSHSRPFVNAKGGDGTARLKRLIHDRSAQNGIRLGYLSENDGDAGKGFREKNVTMRFANVKHAPFVAFLTDLERMGNGATVKELKLRPSNTQAACYKSAECVLSWRYFDEKNGRARR
jgi:hypothetical protein